MQRIFGVSLIFILNAVLISSNQLWPDLSCHPGYNHHHHDDENNRLCLQNTNMALYCYKACMMVELGIVVESKTKLIEMSDWDHRYKRLSLVFPNSPKARVFTKSFEDNCRKLVEEVSTKELECPNWDDLYACVDNTMGCKQTTTTTPTTTGGMPVVIGVEGDSS